MLFFSAQVCEFLNASGGTFFQSFYVAAAGGAGVIVLPVSLKSNTNGYSFDRKLLLVGVICT